MSLFRHIYDPLCPKCRVLVSGMCQLHGMKGAIVLLSLMWHVTKGLVKLTSYQRSGEKINPVISIVTFLAFTALQRRFPPNHNTAHILFEIDIFLIMTWECNP